MSYTYIYRVVEKGTGMGAFRLGLVPYRVACSIPTPRFETPAFDPYQHEEGHYGFTKTQFRKFLDLFDAHTTDTEKDIFAYDVEVRVFRVASEDIRVSASHQTVFHLNTPVRKLPLTKLPRYSLPA